MLTVSGKQKLPHLKLRCHRNSFIHFVILENFEELILLVFWGRQS